MSVTRYRMRGFVYSYQYR